MSATMLHKLRMDIDASVPEEVTIAKLDSWTDVLDAYLTAHAQMVEKVWEVIASHRCIARLAGENDLRLRDTANGWADKLAAAIGDAP